MGFFFKSEEEKLRDRENEAKRRMDRYSAEVDAGRRHINDWSKAREAYYDAQLTRKDYEAEKKRKENSVLHKIVGWPF